MSSSEQLNSLRTHRIVLFTKPAVPGLVKTRLQVADGSGGRVLSAEQSAGLHRAFLKDSSRVLQQVVATREDVQLSIAWALDGDLDPEPGFENVCGFAQVGETLGDRLLHGLSRTEAFGTEGSTGDTLAVKSSADPTVVIAVGSDHPELDGRVVVEALDVVSDNQADLAIGPAQDGGYYLLAVRQGALHGALFHGVEWSSSRVLEQTMMRADELLLRVHTLDLGFDCDTPGDLLALCRRLDSPAFSAPGACVYTRSWLREHDLLAGEAN